jgi:hypothetical protein
MVSAHLEENDLAGRPPRQNWGKFNAHKWGGFNARSQLMNGTQVLSAPIFGQLGPEWLDAGVGDFNGDGRSDILYRRSTDGALLMLLMNGARVLSAPIFAQLGAEWENVGVGDLNGDGKADILFRRSDGSVLVFLMNGTQVQTSAIVSQLGLEWSSCYVSPASPALSLNARK